MITPCIKVCKVAPGTDYCSGCFRMIDEIQHWKWFTDDRRSAIIKECRLREKKLRQQNEEAKENPECRNSVSEGYSIQTKGRKK